MTEQQLRDLIADLERWRGIIMDSHDNATIDMGGQMFYWLEQLRESLPMQQARMEVGA